MDNELRLTNSHWFSKNQIIITVLVWLVFLILSIQVFRPDSILVAFDSDCGIPVLMANEDRPVTVFDTYYWGVDRWGGWPLIIARVVHQASGFQWTGYSSHVVRATWIFLGMLALVWLDRRAALAVLVSCLIPLCLEHNIRWLLFTLSQVYAWQLTALFLAWLCLRRLLAAELLPATGKRMLFERTAWSVGFYFTALLAIWSSEASAPYLAFLLLFEATRSYFLQHDEPANKWKWTRYLTALLIVGAATVSHMLMKANYHRHGLKHWGQEFKAPTWLDVGYLWQNVQGTWRNLIEFAFVPLLFISAVFLLAMTVVVVYAVFIKNRLVRERLMQVALDDDVIMTLGLAGIALINLVLMTLLSHVRLGGYNNRYLLPTFFLGSIAGLMTIYIVLRLVAQRLKLTRYVIPIAVAGAFLFLIVRFPHFELSPRYKRDKETALILARKAPGGVIMGGYWETYIYAALQQPTNTMTPLPLEGLHVRIPWTKAMLRNAREAVIEYRHNEVMNRGPLPAELVEYGNVLKLKDPQFYQDGEYSFALYINEH